MSVQAIQGLPNISLPGPTAFKKRLWVECLKGLDEDKLDVTAEVVG